MQQHKKHQNSTRWGFAALAVVYAIASPLFAQVKANDYMLAGTTTHWGVDVSWFVDDLKTLESLRRILNHGDSENVLKTINKFNSAIIFAVNPTVIANGKIDPKMATFADKDLLLKLEDSLAFLGTCGAQQVTIASDAGYTNVFFVFVFHPVNTIQWPDEAILNCMERIKLAQG